MNRDLFFWASIGAVLLGSFIYYVISKHRAEKFIETGEIDVIWRRLPATTDIKPLKKWIKQKKQILRTVNDGICFDSQFISYSSILKATHYRLKDISAYGERFNVLRIQTSKDVFDIMTSEQVVQTFKAKIDFNEIRENQFGVYSHVIKFAILIIIILYFLLVK